MADVFSAELRKKIREFGVIAVLVVDRAEDAVVLARTLVEGGVRAMELTLRTPAAVQALRAIRAEVPEMLAGIGTILTPDQVREVRDAGAAFGVSPGCNPRVVRAAMDAGLSFAPGVATPSDIEIALEMGCRLLKFFPAEYWHEGCRAFFVKVSEVEFGARVALGRGFLVPGGGEFVVRLNAKTFFVDFPYVGFRHHVAVLRRGQPDFQSRG